MVRGKERDFVFAHDTTRIFQTVCKYASTEIRSELFSSLKEDVLEMTKSRYSVFFVRSLLTRGTKEEKKFIMGMFLSYFHFFGIIIIDIVMVMVMVVTVSSAT